MINEDVRFLKKGTLFSTYAFRFFLAAIISTFVYERNGEAFGAYIVAAAVLVIVFMDFYCTFLYHRNIWSQRLGLTYKMLLIGVCLFYAISSWLGTHIWLYTGFWLFVAFLFGMDFILAAPAPRKKVQKVNF